MINEFEQLEQIEDNIGAMCESIDKRIGTANDDMLGRFLNAIAELGMLLSEFSEQTTEWTCFEAAQQYNERLKMLFESTEFRLLSN